MTVNVCKHNYFKAICFTKPIKYFVEAEYSGNFPCYLYNCETPKCNHFLASDRKMTGFPFKLESRLGKGGFASVYRGKFHEGYAAFKFIRVNEEGYTYDWHAKGCREYTQQETINN